MMVVLALRRGLFVLFVVSDINFRTATCQLHGDFMHGRVVIVVGEENLRLDDLCCIDTLVYRHRVRLVTG